MSDTPEFDLPPPPRVTYLVGSGAGPIRNADGSFSPASATDPFYSQRDLEAFARQAIFVREKRLLRAVHLIMNEWGKTVAEAIAWLDDDARWSDPGFGDEAVDPAAHLVGKALDDEARPLIANAALLASGTTSGVSMDGEGRVVTASGTIVGYAGGGGGLTSSDSGTIAGSNGGGAFHGDARYNNVLIRTVGGGGRDGPGLAGPFPGRVAGETTDTRETGGGAAEVNEHQVICRFFQAQIRATGLGMELSATDDGFVLRDRARSGGAEHHCSDIGAVDEALSARAERLKQD